MVTATLSKSQRCGCWCRLAPIWFQDICGHHDVGQSVLITYRECTSARETLIVVTSQRLKSQAMWQLVQQLVKTNNKETPNPTLLATYKRNKNNNKNSGLPTQMASNAESLSMLSFMSHDVTMNFGNSTWRQNVVVKSNERYDVT